jgi:hypothetical protein
MRVAMDVKAPGPGGPKRHGSKSDEQQTSHRLTGSFDNDRYVPAKYENKCCAGRKQQRVTQGELECHADCAGIPRLLSCRSGGQGGDRHEMISAETVKETECENRDAQHKTGIIARL